MARGLSFRCCSTTNSCPTGPSRTCARFSDNKEVVGIIGPAGTGPSLAVIDMVTVDGRPYMNPIAQTPKIVYPDGDKPRPNVFSFALQNDVEMRMQAQYVAAKKYSKVGILVESTAAGQSAAEILSNQLKSDGLVRRPSMWKPTTRRRRI